MTLPKTPLRGVSPSPTPPVLRNQLLGLLSARDYAALSPHLEPLVLKRGHVVAEPHQPISHVYFLESGVASTVALGSGQRRSEVGIYGREGFGPIALITGINSTPQRHFIQVEGWGYRIPVGAFADVFEGSP